jgi:tetratricopeptide (TPR) repeat protein
VCWQLGEPHDAEQWHTASLEAAREQGSRQWQAHNLAALAEVVCRLGRAAEAERMIQQAIEFSDEINRQHTEAYVLGVAGRVALNLGQPAVQYFERALRIACEISQPYDEIDALIGLAGANLGLGNHSDARVFGEQASARAQEVGYRVLAGRALTVLAEIEFGLGEHGRGVEHADQALELHRQTGHEPGVRRTLRLLGGRVGGTQRSS